MTFFPTDIKRELNNNLIKKIIDILEYYNMLSYKSILIIDKNSYTQIFLSLYINYINYIIPSFVTIILVYNIQKF